MKTVKIQTPNGPVCVGMNASGHLVVTADDPVNVDGGIKCIVVNGKEYRFKDWFIINPDLTLKRMDNIFADRLWDLGHANRPPKSEKAIEKIKEISEQAAYFFLKNHQDLIFSSIRNVFSQAAEYALEQRTQAEKTLATTQKNYVDAKSLSEEADETNDLSALLNLYHLPTAR